MTSSTTPSKPARPVTPPVPGLIDFTPWARKLSLALAEGVPANPESLAELDRPALADALLRDAVEHRATDIHLDQAARGLLVRLRIDGRVVDAAVLSSREGERLINQFKMLAEIPPVHLFTPISARRSYSVEGFELDLRLTAAPCLTGQSLAIRMLHPENVEHHIGDLGLSKRHDDQLDEWLRNLNGMFVCTGPTGSGKTTTLYALLRELKQHDRRIVTIEDPVEYQIDGINQIQVNERHGLTFAEGIRTILRMDPDYVLVGEIRDPASAQVAGQASISGRVLLTTLHARDVFGAVTSLRNYGLPVHEIAAALAVVVNQRLVRRLCANCRQEEEPTEVDVSWYEALGLETPKTLWYAKGCSECHHLGYLGRTGVFEVWRLTERDYSDILAKVDEHTMRERMAEEGHLDLLDDALTKVARGITSLEEIRGLGHITPYLAGK